MRNSANSRYTAWPPVSVQNHTLDRWLYGSAISRSVSFTILFGSAMVRWWRYQPLIKAVLALPEEQQAPIVVMFFFEDRPKSVLKPIWLPRGCNEACN
jgi:hypothetical protein